MHQFERPLEMIGKYQAVRLLGRGGMGAVYLAYDEQTERYVAIKQLHDNQSHARTFDKLRKEARFLAKLNHRNIVQLYDLLDTGNGVAIVLEYVKGLPLSHYLNTCGYTFSQAFEWLTELSCALDYAHTQGVIHRDLKADNILINEGAEVKIMDFGIAHSADSTGEPITRDGIIKGSPSALAPEQVKGLPITVQCDMFALGILAYQLFYGCHPFGPVHNAMMIIHRIAYEDFIVPDKSKGNLPDVLTSLIARLLNKDPELRPTAKEVVAMVGSINPNKSYVLPGTLANETMELGATRGVRQRLESLSVGSFLNIKTLSAVTSRKTATLLIIVLSVSVAGIMALQELIFRREIFVAVLPPRLAQTGDQNSGSETVARIVQHAIEQAIIETEHYHLIPESEFSNLQINTRSVGASVGADLVVEADIQCTDERCEIDISAIEKGDWSVVARKQWPVVAVDTLNIYASSQHNLAHLITASNNTQAFDEWISEENYLVYLEAEQRFRQFPSGYQDALITTEKLIHEAPKYTPLYDLYSNAAVAAYFATDNVNYLNNLKLVLERAKYLVPDSPTLYLGLFRFALASKDAALAKGYISSLQSLGVGQDVTIPLQARVEMLNKNIDAAIDYYKLALRLRPNAKTMFRLARAQWLGGYGKEAKQRLQKLFSLSPQHASGLTLAAQIALAEGDLAAAAGYYESLFALQPDSYSYSNLGLVNLLRGNYEDAKKYFTRAAVLSGEHPTDLLNLADTEQLLGNREVADTLYKKIISGRSETGHASMEIETSIAQSYAHLGSFHPAIEIIQDLLINDPNNVTVLFSAALVYTLAEDNQSAMVFINKAKNLGLGSIWFQLPWFDPLCQKSAFSPGFHKSEKAGFCIK